MGRQVFAVGDDLIAEMAGGFMSMPLWVLMGQIVPAGTEGSVFALVTSLRAMGTGVSGTWTSLARTSLVELRSTAAVTFNR